MTNRKLPVLDFRFCAVASQSISMRKSTWPLPRSFSATHLQHSERLHHVTNHHVMCLLRKAENLNGYQAPGETVSGSMIASSSVAQRLKGLFTLGDAQSSFFMSASKFNIEFNGEIFDVSAKNDRASRGLHIG